MRLNSQSDVKSHSQVLVDKKRKKEKNSYEKVNLNNLTIAIEIKSEHSPSNKSKPIKTSVSV